MKASDAINSIATFKVGQRKFTDWAATHGRENLALKLQDCGSWLKFREWLETGESRLRQAYFCKKFLVCRCCAAIRAGKMIQKYKERIEFVQAENPKLIPAMITLTVKNGDDLMERMFRLEVGFGKMIGAARFARSGKRRDTKVEWNKVQGFVASYEVTNEGKGWHPHIHAFVLLNKYIDQKQLSEEWLRFTGDSYIVGVTKCRNKNLIAALCETMKYSCKMHTMKPEHVMAVSDAFKGKRWINAGGLLRGVKVPDIDSDDCTGMTGPYIDYVARWLHSQGRYDIRQDTGSTLVIERPNRNQVKG